MVSPDLCVLQTEQAFFYLFYYYFFITRILLLILLDKLINRVLSVYHTFVKVRESRLLSDCRVPLSLVGLRSYVKAENV